MKSIFLSFLAIALICVAGVIESHAGTITATWTASTGAKGYYLYMDGKRLPNPEATANGVTVSISGLTGVIKFPASMNGAHSFYCTAYNEWGESAPSNTVTTPPLAEKPGQVTVVIVSGGD